MLGRSVKRHRDALAIAVVHEHLPSLFQYACTQPWTPRPRRNDSYTLSDEFWWVQGWSELTVNPEGYTPTETAR